MIGFNSIVSLQKLAVEVSLTLSTLFNLRTGIRRLTCVQQKQVRTKDYLRFLDSWTALVSTTV